MFDLDKNDSNDISIYENHFALSGKDKGCSKQLIGKVCIVAFLIQEERSAWTKEEIADFRDVLKKVQFELLSQADLSKNRLQVSYAFDVVSVQLNFDRDLYKNLESAVLKQYGTFSNSADYQKHYEEKFLKDEAPVVFVLNRKFRSFALCSDVFSPNSTNESSFVSFTGNKDTCTRTIIHELLHQFGAIDYYLPEKVKTSAEKFFPNSIMNLGNQIDTLTRYIIGWDEEPKEEVFSFLEETKDVTEQDIIEARKKDSDNDW